MTEVTKAPSGVALRNKSERSCKQPPLPPLSPLDEGSSLQSDTREYYSGGRSWILMRTATPSSDRHSISRSGATPFTRLTRFGGLTTQARAGRAQHACSSRTLEPAAAIRHPPTQDKNWNACAQCPPHRQNEIGSETQDCERKPEHLSFHATSLRSSRRCHFRADQKAAAPVSATA